MATPNLPTIARCAIVSVYNAGSSDEQSVSNVFHVLSDSGNITDASCVTLKNGIGPSWTTNIRPLTGNNVNLRRVTVEPYRGAGSPVFENDGDFPGTNAAAAEPANVTWAATLHTDVSSRRTRGRWYFVGMPLGQRSDDTHIASAFADSIVAALAALQSDIAALDIGLGLAVFSKTNAAARFVADGGIAVTSLRLCTQRRRLGR